jgi:hypothetical protein
MPILALLGKDKDFEDAKKIIDDDDKKLLMTSKRSSYLYYLREKISIVKDFKMNREIASDLHLREEHDKQFHSKEKIFKISIAIINLSYNIGLFI